MMNRWLKVAFFAVLLIGTGYWFGAVCRQIGSAHTLILTPTKEILILLVRFLLAVGGLLVSAGLVAALVRPVWVGFIIIALSGVAMLLGWQVTAVSGVMVLVYLLAACIYTFEIARELGERIRFSVRPVGAGQGLLLIALILVASGSLYLGSAAHIEREGFSIPEVYIEIFMEQMEKQIEGRLPAEAGEEELAEFREELRQTVDDFSEDTVKQYERFIPVGIVVSVFTTLVTITRLLIWVPVLVLGVVFPLLTKLGVTKIVSETKEVERLVIE